MANGIYEGGVVDGNPDFSFPAQDGGATQFQPAPGAGGAGRIGYTKGGAPEMNGSYGAQSGDVNFVDGASYKGDMSVDDDPKMVVRNPDSVNSDRSGKMP